MSIPETANGHPFEADQGPSPQSKDTPASEKTVAFVSSPAARKDGAHPPEPGSSGPPKPKRKPKKPNYAQIHSKPLPLTVHPLPAFHPSNPISLLRLSYIYICHLLSPPSSHPETLMTGLFSPRTRSVHITEPEHVRALWEMGFFGKGTLSRSEPSWLEREKAKARAGVGGGAEAATAKRREERRLFKLERARLEREKIERQRAVEEGRVVPDAESEGEGKGKDAETALMEDDDERTLVGEASPLPNGNVDSKALNEGRVPDADLLQATDSTPAKPPSTNQSPSASAEPDAEPEGEIDNQEHLQLSLEEAFYLTYALGILSTHPPPPSLNPAPFHPGPTPYSTTDLLFLSCHHTAFPPVDAGSGIAPDDQFLLNYATYHHFRSLGWVVRPGTKFGVDYLLYNRGPVFSHAEFAVLIIPSYTHRYWNTPGGRSRRRVHHPFENTGFSTAAEDGGVPTISSRRNRSATATSSGSALSLPGVNAGPLGDGKDWWFLHGVNRVQSAVKKSLVLCYVDVPCPWEVGLDDEWDVDVDVGRLLRGYRVREFVLRRWVINRSRD